MTIWWCRGCGMEDTQAHNACSSCGNGLQVAEVEWLEPDSKGDETTYELDISSEERAALVQLLIDDKVPHRWEKTADLVVATDDEEATDALLDEVLGEEDGDEGDEDNGDDLDGNGESEGDYEVLSAMYLATKNLISRREPDEIGDFLEITSIALETPTPFGVEDDMWADIQSNARNISAALEVDSEASVHGQLQDLQLLLHRLV